jgi:peptidoglycan hydrolase-like protein with peptidoglycan-binding domain
MGKFPIALLIVVFQQLAVMPAQADEQVRRLQEELRKRHLFYGNLDGEFGPDLGAALSRYQTKKGFPVTGLLDAETCASLGIIKGPTPVAPTPFVVAKTGDVRGMNGELLPSWTPLFAPATDCAFPGDSGPADDKTIAPVRPNKTAKETQSAGKGARPRTRTAARGANARRESNPFVLAYHSVDHALKFVFRDSTSRKKRDPKKRG